ncbi:UNVERIFIED_CONTAM: GGDEF domain-containing protein [Paenibacillus sp. PvR008]
MDMPLNFFKVRICGKNAYEHKVGDMLLREASLHGHRLSVTGSIGIRMNPSQKENLQTLLKEADIAMYHAKKQSVPL